MASTEIELFSLGPAFLDIDPVNAVLPVPCGSRCAESVIGPTREGDQELTRESHDINQTDQSEKADGRDGPTSNGETVGRGWVVPPSGARVEALFMVSPQRLGIGKRDGDESPVWFDLSDITSVDEIGDPVDDLLQVEFVTLDGTKVAAGWTGSFCRAVITALEATVDRSASPSDTPSDNVVRPTGVLELEDVTYLGGFPGETRRRKRCTATLSAEGLEVNGPAELRMRLAWDTVRSLEAQNSDEARFRTNTKIHRDSSALVFECDEDVTVTLEARDCPTVPLRQAITTLLEGIDVTVK